jgi:hypothetical protein
LWHRVGSCCEVVVVDDGADATDEEGAISSSKSRDRESLSGVTKCDALGSDDCDVSSTKPPIALLSVMLAWNEDAKVCYETITDVEKKLIILEQKAFERVDLGRSIS